jgi:hypothetical protein
MKKQEDSYNPNDDLSALAGEEKAAIVAFKMINTTLAFLSQQRSS